MQKTRMLDIFLRNLRVASNRYWISALLILLSFEVSQALSLTTIRNPRTFPLNNSSLSIKAMAFSCLALPQIPDDLPCQPALLQKEKDPRFAINLPISNGYASTVKARRLLANDLDAEFMDSLFKEDKILEVEGNPSLMFSSRYIAAKYLYGLQYYSTQRNQANPEIQMQVAESKQFILQSSYAVWSNVYIGGQFRNQQDKMIQKSFRLVDLGTDNGKDLLKPVDYGRLFFEPGIAATVKDTTLSVFGANIQIAGDRERPINDGAEAQFGISQEISILSGTMNIALDYKSLSYSERDDQKVHFGTRYKYGALNLLAGVDSWGLSGGMLFSIEKLYAGILYSTSQIPWRSSSDYANTTYIELGWQL